jgi:NAD(P)H-dependent flavin oxidoreductase YrpB (nitropropane dioxygenase family)
MLSTRLTEQIGLEVPFVGAGMGFVATPPLVAAISDAGGMGTRGASPMPPEAVRAMIQAIRSMTSGPFGVNFITRFTEDAHVDVCLEEKVPVVSFHWDEPPAGFVSRLQDGGV